MAEKNEEENKFSEFSESLNADKSFKTSQDYLEKRLAGVDEVINNNAN